MKKRILLMCAFCVSLFVINCTSADELETSNSMTKNDGTAELAGKTSGQYVCGVPYSLNVMYFIPSDQTPRPDYERRLSEVMHNARQFYLDNMKMWGYGERTFGMFTNLSNLRIKINIVRGAHPLSYYSASEGFPRVQSELNAYFVKYPAEKGSDHSLVFLPAVTTQISIPFAGTHGISIVRDYDDFDMKYLTQTGAKADEFKLYYGGLLHELGHCMDLIHNSNCKTHEKNLGTSLMGYGNTTMGHSPTILSKSDCEILLLNQLFSPVEKPNYFYRGNNSFTMTSMGHSVSAANDYIWIYGTFTSVMPVKRMIVYFDPEGGGDYDAVSGIGTVSGNSFSCYVQVKELHNINANYKVRLYPRFDDGGSNYAEGLFKITNGIPNSFSF